MPRTSQAPPPIGAPAETIMIGPNGGCAMTPTVDVAEWINRQKISRLWLRVIVSLS